MIKITHRTNLTIVVKIVDLGTSCIYSCNHMVGMDNISSSVPINGLKILKINLHKLKFHTLFLICNMQIWIDHMQIYENYFIIGKWSK
jgi:hypothetical protein